MTRDEAVVLIEGRLGQRIGLTTLIQNELKAAQSKLEEGAFLPWFLKKVFNYNTVVNLNNTTLPTDFIREVEDDEANIMVSGVWKNLKRDFHNILTTNPDLQPAPAQPQFYTIFANGLVFYPTPNAVYPVAFFYYGKDVVLSTNIENQWLKYASDYLIACAGLRVAKTLRDPTFIQLFDSDRKEAHDEALRANRAHEVFETVRGE